MRPLGLVRPVRVALVLAAVAVGSLVCGPLTHWVPARAHAEDASRANALAQALIAGAPRHVPKGYASANASRLTLTDDDRRGGMVAAVQVALGGGDPKGSIRYAVFQSEQEAKAFMQSMRQRLPPGALKFLPYLTAADCVDAPNGGLCSLLVGDIVIVAVASQVDRGAALALLSGKEALEAARTSSGQSSGPPAPAPAPKAPAAGSRDGCALLTKADAEAALGGPVADPRRSSDTCHYGSRAVAGDGVTLQLIEGGRSKFDFDRGRIQSVVALPGIGDGAFAFVSQAGFVQLYFIKGAGYVSVTLQNARDANRLESAKALARKIAARL